MLFIDQNFAPPHVTMHPLTTPVFTLFLLLLGPANTTFSFCVPVPPLLVNLGQPSLSGMYGGGVGYYFGTSLVREGSADDDMIRQ